MGWYHEYAMIPLIRDRQQAIAKLCQRYAVRRLELFGSAADGRFDPATSDLDFLVAFGPHQELNAFHQFFRFREALSHLLERQVDLVDATAMRNPYFIAQVNRSREPLYAA